MTPKHKAEPGKAPTDAAKWDADQIAEPPAAPRVPDTPDTATDAEKWDADQISEPPTAPRVPDTPDTATDAEKWRTDTTG